MGGLSLHLPVRRGAGSAQKKPLWRYSDLGESGEVSEGETTESEEGFCPTDEQISDNGK